MVRFSRIAPDNRANNLPKPAHSACLLVPDCLIAHENVYRTEPKWKHEKFTAQVYVLGTC